MLFLDTDNVAGLLVVVGVAVVDEGLHEFDDLGNGLAGLGLDVGRADAQGGHVGAGAVDVDLGPVQRIHAVFVGGGNDLVVHIRPVAHIGHIVALVFQIAADHIELQRLLGVADVGVGVGGDAAGVHPYLLVLYGLEFRLFPGKTVINLHSVLLHR